jgi:dihydroorotase
VSDPPYRSGDPGDLPGLDLVVSGARIFDPDHAGMRFGEIGVRAGRIAAVADRVGSLSAPSIVRADGLLLTPGLVDLHAHVFAGQDLGVAAAELLPTGVTTVVDAGSSGADLYRAFHRIAMCDGAVRVRALLNISSIGTTSILRAGELSQPGYLDEAACVACALAHPDDIVGIKVRASDNVGPGQVPAAFAAARRVADATALPLMVHVGPAPMRLDVVCDALGAGDIVTHCYSGLAEPRLAGGNGVLAAAERARARGVLFDVGHGNAGFDAGVARHAIAAGFGPDTISSDLHAYSREAVVGLPDVVAKLVALGLDLEMALRAVTLAPARAVGLDTSGVGTLRIGADADLTLFAVGSDPVRFTDTRGSSFIGSLTLRPTIVWRRGVRLDVEHGVEDPVED